MIDANFLFPRDLEVVPTRLRKILIIGSCLAEAFVSRFREDNPNTQFDLILFNNASDLPKLTPDEVRDYDFQYIQIPIRSVLTDAATRIADFDKSAGAGSLLALGKQNLDRMLDAALSYNAKTGLLTFVSNFIVPQVRFSPGLKDQFSTKDMSFVVSELNTHLAARIRAVRNAYIADIEAIAGSLGKAYFLDDSISFTNHGSLIYPDWHHFESYRIEPVPPIGDHYEIRTNLFFSMVYRQIEHLYRVVNQIDMVKIVIFDLDNTMWRGQLAEDYTAAARCGIDGWPLGIWDAVNQLRWRGVLVAVASKNDEVMVKERWDDIVQPPFVKYADFVAHKIGWNAKSSTIRELLAQVSLTAKSAVFVDDNPVEREAVKAEVPGIRVIGSNPLITKRILLWSSETQLSTQTAESARREEMIQRQLEREEQRSGMSHEEFLAGLETKLNIWQVPTIDHPSFSRCFELVNKTNQFNTTGQRWTIETCTKFLGEGGKLYAFSVRDRFTDYGLVGVVFVLRNAILQFVMSCRVLGMEVEKTVTGCVCHEIRADGFAEVHATLLETPSNTPCRDVFIKSGFCKDGVNGGFVLSPEHVVAPSRTIEVLAA